MQQAVARVMENEDRPTELEADGDPSIKLNPNAVSPVRFINYAAGRARLHRSDRTYQFLPLRCTEADQMTLETMNFLLSANNVFGIYSESPFLRPVTLLRPVQFACPSNILHQYPDPENMVRTLRDLADQKVTSIPLLSILSGAKPNAASLGFYTGYLTYSFTLVLDNNTMRILVDQSRRPHDGADKYRLILRLAWATAGLYMPRDKSTPSRVLASEVLPRCLSVRVARRNVTLPDPIFHGGQAQKFGHRLRFAIDITDKIVTRSNFLVRGRGVEIDLTWLHAPLEDHALPLLEMVGSGSCTPILNHLLNLPLIQVTLDRVQPIPEFARMFSSAVAGESVTDPPPGCKPPRLPSETPEALAGVYDFCMSSDRVIAASETLAMIRSKLTSEDDLQSDGWIPVSLLCPLALTRIEIPVRSVNCDHLQCFDLSSYLTINKKRPRWSCPVCSSPTPFRDLRRDDFFVQLMADPSLSDAKMIHVDANGHWREASKPTEGDFSATVSANESIPGIPTDKPATAVVPSPLNRTSAMSPCILESDLSSEAVAPTEPGVTQSSDCVVLIDDDDDEDQANDATQPEQPTFAHSTSFNDFCAPFPPAAVTDEQPAELPSAAPEFAPTNLFVDLAASSDEEPDVTMASTPPLSSPEPSAVPTPSSISPTTTESCSLPAVIPSPSLARLSVDIAPLLPVSSQPSNLISHATQALPPPAAADAAVVNAAGTSSTTQASPPPNKAIGLFVDLAASSDEEPDVTMASTPPLSSPEPSAAPTPPSISPTTTESCSLPAVIPSSSLAPIPSVLPRPLNLVGNSTQPFPPPPAADADAAIVSAAGTSSTSRESPSPNKLNKATGMQTAKKARKAAPQVNKPSELAQILAVIQSPNLVQYLQAKGVLASEVRCRCRKPMQMQILRQHTDGFAFRCNKCGTKRALRAGSVFEGSHLTLPTAVRTALAFLEGTGVIRCAALVGISVTAAVEWYDIWRDVCTKALLKEVNQLGGPEVEVQVDETMITRRIYNVGQLRKQHWILGMYDTKIRKAIFEQVNDRSWSSLKAVIKKWVAPGSVIVTDEWKEYARLTEEGYRHLTVNRSANFVDPATKKNANAIEAYWNRLKKKLREHGPVKGRKIWAHVDEAQYRLWYGVKASNLSEAWERFLSHVAQAYPVAESDIVAEK